MKVELTAAHVANLCIVACDELLRHDDFSIMPHDQIIKELQRYCRRLLCELLPKEKVNEVFYLIEAEIKQLVNEWENY